MSAEASGRKPLTGPVDTGAMRKPTLLLVDDDPLLLRQLGRLARSKGVDVEPATDTERASHVLDEHSVDGALVDLRIGRECGLELLGRIHARAPTIPLWLMTGFDPREVQNAAGRLGAIVFLKPLTGPDLESLLESVRAHAARHRPLHRLHGVDSLSAQERRCLVLAVDRRLRAAAIAEEIGISANSVRTYLRRACDKLGFDTPEDVRRHLREPGELP